MLFDKYAEKRKPKREMFSFFKKYFASQMKCTPTGKKSALCSFYLFLICMPFTRVSSPIRFLPIRGLLRIINHT